MGLGVGPPAETSMTVMGLVRLIISSGISPSESLYLARSRVGVRGVGEGERWGWG